MIIRPLLAADLEQLMAIELDAHQYPWKETIHRSCIEEGYPSQVLEVNNQIVAYAIYNFLYDECHLMNITTRRGMQGKGLATELIRHMYQDSIQHDIQNILLEVRVSNRPAIEFYLKEGFAEIAQRPGYYPTNDGREDALVMQKSLTC